MSEADLHPLADSPVPQSDNSTRRPTSLAGRAETTRALLARLGEERTSTHQRDRYADRAAELDAAAVKLAPWPAIQTVYRERDVPIIVDAQAVARLRQATRQVAKDYEASRPSILEASQARDEQFWSPLQRLPTQLETARRAAWGTFCTKVLPSPREERLNVLERVPDWERRVARVRGLLLQATERRTKPGALAQDFRRIELLVQEIESAMQQLGGEISDELFTFINEATSPAGADLAKLTDSIRAGLKQMGLDGLLRVRLDAARGDGRR